MSSPQCMERRDDIAAYTIEALETAEKLELERHIAGCEACADYLAWVRTAADLVPMSVEYREPPRSLKTALMSEVQADLKAEKRAAKDRKQGERGFWGTFWRPITAGVASFLLVAGVVTGYLVRGGEEPVETNLIQAERTEKGVGPAMVATLEQEGDDGTLHVEKLPGLPRSENYQAWIQRDGRMIPSTTFVVRNDGSNEVAIEGSLADADGVAITREPEGGSEIPTAPVIMSAELG